MKGKKSALGKDRERERMGRGERKTPNPKVRRNTHSDYRKEGKKS